LHNFVQATSEEAGAGYGLPREEDLVQGGLLEALLGACEVDALEALEAGVRHLVRRLTASG